MCPPTHFDVTYAINPWMNTSVPVNRARALAQWKTLRETYKRLGHRVDTIEPLPEMPDMVFAANGAFVVDGRAYGAQFANAERSDEAPAYRNWLSSAGVEDVHIPKFVNEGEGDFTVVGDYVLAGTGFRTDHAAHLEAQEFFGRPVISLTLTDPRFYHLDTALFVLDDKTIAYFPAAFATGSQEVLRRMFPSAILATEADALAFGLNSTSDGKNVVVAAAAHNLADQLSARGYVPIPVDLSELLKAGGGAKCCTLELRPSP
jgi:N-dimethylarginine dimethylaminohydrolase